MSHYELSLDEFRRLAADNQAPRVPVYRTLLGDCLTPVAAYAGLAGDGCGFLLESVEQGERVVRNTAPRRDGRAPGLSAAAR